MRRSRQTIKIHIKTHITLRILERRKEKEWECKKADYSMEYYYYLCFRLPIFTIYSLQPSAHKNILDFILLCTVHIKQKPKWSYIDGRKFSNSTTNQHLLNGSDVRHHFSNAFNFKSRSLFKKAMLVPNAVAADVNECHDKMRLFNVLNIEWSQRNFVLIELLSHLNYKWW